MGWRVGSREGALPGWRHTDSTRQRTQRAEKLDPGPSSGQGAAPTTPEGGAGVWPSASDDVEGACWQAHLRQHTANGQASSARLSKCTQLEQA